MISPFLMPACAAGPFSSTESTYTPVSWEACLTISVEGKDFYCFWLKGTEAQMKDLKVGDTITVSGTIKNYNGTIEFEKPQMQ